MPDKCVVFGCNNRPSKGKGISLHPIPFDWTDDTEKRKRRKKWVDFVKLKRARWETTKYLAVCSKQFPDEEYSVMFSDLAKIDWKNFHITPCIYYARRLINYVCALLFQKTIATP